MLRTTVTPGVSMGTSTCDCCRWGAASGSVLPITIEIAQCGCMAPEMNHLRPLSTYSSPRRSIRSWMLVASEDATAGSVMAKHERISPSRRGCNHRSCCSGVPNIVSTSMLPVSGAEQLHASDAIGDRPMISANGA